MANPQAENGHIDIAHEIIEALAKYRLSGQEWQCLLIVFRKTYGWKKTEDEISLSQFQRMTGLSRPGVVRALTKLVSKQVLVSTHIGTTHAKKYKFNKNYEQWSTSTQRRTSGNFKLVPKRVPELVPKQIMVPVPKWVHTKENSTKETSKEKDATTKKGKRKSPLTDMPVDFGISDRIRDWALKNKHTDLEKHLENFKLSVASKSYQYADWDAAFMKAIRDNWAKIGGGNAGSQNGCGQRPGGKSFAERDDERYQQSRLEAARIAGIRRGRSSSTGNADPPKNHGPGATGVLVGQTIDNPEVEAPETD